MKFRNLLTVAFLMLTVNIQADPLGENPFGFKMGMSEEEIKAMEGVTVDTSMARRMGKHNAGLVRLSKAPHPYPPFVHFDLYISKKHGLFKIIAWSSKIEIGQGGQNIMSKYVEIREELAKRYNGFLRAAYIEGGATWETPNDWLTRVQKKGIARRDMRVFFSEWSPRRFKRSEQIVHIDLSIYVNYPVSFCLTFEFTNTFQAMWGD